MGRLARPLALVCSAVVLGGGIAQARIQGTAAQATAPTAGALYTEGPDGRYLLGGSWLFRLDPANAGLSAGYSSSSSAAGWSPVTVPNAWNANDMSAASMAGTVAWYRRDFRLPSASNALTWIVRFESVNFNARVWLNGRLIGSHVGAFLPFEFALAGLNRRGVNRLVIRVDNRRVASPTGPQPPNGWWNFGGILREVYLRSVDRVDFSHVVVRPTLPCARCSATIEERTTVHNYSRRAQVVHVAGAYGALSLDLGTRTIAAGADRDFAATTTLAHPRLWAPGHANLYPARLSASAVTAGSKSSPTHAAGYTALSGVRSIRVVKGRLQLNFRPLHLRGLSIIDDHPARGGAVNNSDRAQIIAQARDLRATMIRAQYPMHPELEELADRNGILTWSQIPIYQMSDRQVVSPPIASYARQQLSDDIAANQNHPSVAVWAIANELATTPTADQDSYISSQTALAKGLDPTRPVGISNTVNPSAGCRAADYAPLDLLGFDDYFGWYTGPQGVIADRDQLSSYLDSLHQCYRNQAVMIAEFGVEANRDGPVEEKGTYQFQNDFINFHLGVYRTKSWLAGAIYFTLREFRVRPEWNGGNPWAAPPMHQKGLITFAGVKKPSYFLVRKLFRATKQY